jgi:pimeloyl-ACP methyl ester carboxylesterase
VPPLQVNWGACPDGFVSECAQVSVPLDWATPSGQTIPVFLSRMPTRAAAARGQLWLLQGGPGGSGEEFVSVVPTLAQLLPDLDIVVLEHRGVGLSSRLGCPTAESPASAASRQIDTTEWRDCITAVEGEWGDRLAFFNITQAANDLAHLAAATRRPGQQLFIYGVSYGTSWAQRFLQLRPDDATGVVLDSIVAPGVLFLSKFDQGFDPVARRLAGLCAADVACAAKLGSDPWARLAEVFAKLDQGHCPALAVDRLTWSSLMAFLIEALDLRTAIFPLFYRLDRCAPADVDALTHFFSLFDPGPDPGPMRFSEVLQYNIALSELWETPPPDAAEIARRRGDALFWPGLLDAAAPLHDTWPRYPLDSFANRWPTPTSPILGMNGTLDPQTPIEQARGAVTALAGAHQSFVEFPGSPHGVIFNTPVNGGLDLNCGVQVMLGFLNNPTAPLDTRCLAELDPVAFSWPDGYPQAFLGTSDMWENPIANQYDDDLAAPAPAPDWPVVLRNLRRSPLGPSRQQPSLTRTDLLR